MNCLFRTIMRMLKAVLPASGRLPVHRPHCMHVRRRLLGSKELPADRNFLDFFRPLEDLEHLGVAASSARRRIPSGCRSRRATGSPRPRLLPRSRRASFRHCDESRVNISPVDRRGGSVVDASPASTIVAISAILAWTYLKAGTGRPERLPFLTWLIALSSAPSRPCRWQASTRPRAWHGWRTP